jgi:septum formation protein
MPTVGVTEPGDSGADSALKLLPNGSVAYAVRMATYSGKIVLGSRSPRRRELLSSIVSPDRIAVVPPRQSEEADFEGLRTASAIETRLREIARTKNDDVRSQLIRGWQAVLTADTTIVGYSDTGLPTVLGQPPDDDSWRDVVRGWFRDFYIRRPHAALTAVSVSVPDGRRLERVVRSEVTFAADGEPFLEWYLATGEPRGKAGGYALQGAGSLFVERVHGSPSNVVGLPLRETWELLREAGVEVGFTGPPVAA